MSLSAAALPLLRPGDGARSEPLGQVRRRAIFNRCANAQNERVGRLSSIARKCDRSPTSQIELLSNFAAQAVIAIELDRQQSRIALKRRSALVAGFPIRNDALSQGDVRQHSASG